MEGLDTRIFAANGLLVEADAQLKSPELDRFWKWYLAHSTSKPKTKIQYCSRYILSCESKIARSTDETRKRQILVGIAAARSRLGTELYSIADPSAETILSQAVVEACITRHPETAYNALHALGLYYQRIRQFEYAELLYMRSIAFAGFLGPGCINLVLDRLAYVMHRSGKPQKASWLEGWESTCSPMPLNLLKKRAKTLFENGVTNELEKETELTTIASCWHIGRALAACSALGLDKRALELREEGLKLAKEQEDTIWIRSFDQLQID